MFKRSSFEECALALSILAPATIAAQAVPGGAAPTRPGVRLENPTHLFVVDDTPSPCRYSADIQSAVNAACEGDVILVKSGFYFGFPAFAIDGKSLCLIGEGRPQASFEVKNLQRDQRVIVRGFQGNSPPRFTRNAGPIWIEDCSWSGTAPRQPISQGSKVGFFRCQVGGGSRGNPAFIAERSTTFAYHSTFEGTQGVDAYFSDDLCEHSGGYECDWYYSSPGGAGMVLRGGSTYLFGCSLSGGRGGSDREPYCGGYHISGCDVPDYLPGSCGGNALVLGGITGETKTTVLQTQLVGGLPDCDNTPVSGLGTLTTLQGRTGEFSVDSPVRAGSPLHYRIKGPTGMKAFVSYAFDFMPRFEQDKKGFSVLPIGAGDHFTGTLPASGVLDMTAPLGDLLEPGSEAQVFYVQSKLYDPAKCTIVLGAPSALVVVRDPCP